MAADGDGSCGGSEADALVDAAAFRECNGPGGDAGVTGGCGIHRGNIEGGGVQALSLHDQQQSMFTERDESIPGTAAGEIECGGDCGGTGVDGQSGEFCGFGFVGAEPVRLPEIGRQRVAGGSGVELHGDIVLPRDLQGSCVCRFGNFELQQQDIGGGDGVFSGVDIGRGEKSVGTGFDDDGVLSGIFDGDQCHSAGCVGCGVNAGNVDSFTFEATFECAAERVIADASDHGDTGSEASCCGSLIGSFAAGDGLRAMTADGFAGLREFLAAEHEVHVEGTDDDDLWLVARHGVGF